MPGPLPRILIVDDEAAQMQALCETLRERGYDTAGFGDGAAALTALRAAPFDLMLADLMMPGMDGIALLQAAREIDPELVVIIMTGEGTIASAVDAMKAGALDYILKPFKLSAILPVLARALAIRGLRRENAALERRVREHTAELEAANKELEAFSYSVSHDLRSPLTVIAGCADTLIDECAGQLPPQGHELVALIVKSAERMARLIDDLLRLSRLGRQTLSTTPVDVAQLVREVLDDLRRTHAGPQPEVRVHDLPGCVGDRALLGQVFINLLSNAFKFTRGEKHPTVEVICRREAGVQVYSVRDNGAGFDMRDAAMLFGAFQRLHGADRFEGSGVGLSIARRIVQRHGGRIWAEAKPGEGATFHFSIPG